MENENDYAKLFMIYADNEITRGKGGVLYIKDKTISYKFSSEFDNKDFAKKLQDVLDDDGENNIYFVLEKEKNLHLMAYPKSSLPQPAPQDTLGNKTD